MLLVKLPTIGNYFEIGELTAPQIHYLLQFSSDQRFWSVQMVFIGKTWHYKLKHQAIDDVLTGKKYLFPMFNRANNEFLLTAMEMTGMKYGKYGFEKDNTAGKFAETEDDPLELRTDGTDAWDDLFIGLNFFPQQFSILPFEMSID